MHVSNSVTDELATLFLATGLSHGPTALESTETDLTLDWVPFDEVMAMVLDGRITDAMSVVALQRVALERAAVVRSVRESVGSAGACRSMARRRVNRRLAPVPDREPGIAAVAARSAWIAAQRIVG